MGADNTFGETNFNPTPMVSRDIEATKKDMSDNELIAEFMGVESVIEKGKQYWHIIDPEKKRMIYAIKSEELSYHRDWNRLMPVVEKCKNSQRGKYHDRTRVLYVDVCLALEEVNIQKAHKAVVEFIKWYNQNKYHYGQH